MRKLVVGTQIEHPAAWHVAQGVPGLALCTFPNQAGLPQAPPGERALIVDSRSCPGTTKWLAAVRRLQPDYALTPPIGALHTWEFLRPYCREANYLCGQEVLVLVQDPAVVEPVQQEGFTVAVLGDSSPAAVPPWAVSPGRVWVVGGSPLDQWRRFAELAFVGCDLRGVVLDSSWLWLGERGLAVGHSPYRLERAKGTLREKRRRSLVNLYEFWRTVGEAYGRR